MSYPNTFLERRRKIGGKKSPRRASVRQEPNAKSEALMLDPNCSVSMIGISGVVVKCNMQGNANK